MAITMMRFVDITKDAAGELTRSHRSWTAYLQAAGRLYTFTFPQQLAIYAQRPEATACTSYDGWLAHDRQVKYRAKGIALMDDHHLYPRLRYVFDVSDTYALDRSPDPTPWTISEDAQSVVAEAIHERYGVDLGKGLLAQLDALAHQEVQAYWEDFRSDILRIVDGSALDDYDHISIEQRFKAAASASLAYTLMDRCGLEPDRYFEPEDFAAVYDFDAKSVTALGSAISRISGEVLRGIAEIIKDEGQRKSAERTEDNERAELQAGRGVSGTESDAGRADGGSDRQVRPDAQDAFGEQQAPDLRPDDNGGDAVRAPGGDRQAGGGASGTDDAPGEGPDEPERGTQGQRPDGLGRADEQPESAGGRSHSGGSDLQLNQQLNLFESPEMTAGAVQQAERGSFSHFAFSYAEEETDHILRLGGNERQSRERIADQYMISKPLEEIAAFLSREYVGGSGLVTDKGRLSAWYAEDGIHIARGNAARYISSAQVMTWQEAAARIGELLDEGRFASHAELAEANNHVRRRLADSLLFLYQDLSDTAHQYGHLTSIKVYHAMNHGERTARLAEALAEPRFLRDFTTEYQRFLNLYKDQPDLLRFHHHRTDELPARLRDLALPRQAYTSDMADVPQTGRFITEDEIDSNLAVRASAKEGSKERIYHYFIQKRSLNERAAFLKAEYGTGGYNHALPGSFHSGMDYSPKGIYLKKPECPDVVMTWNQAARRVDDLILHKRYPIPRTLDDPARTVTADDIDEALREGNSSTNSQDNAVDIIPDIRDDEDDVIDVEALKERLAQRGFHNGEFTDPEALDNDPFIRMVQATVDQIAEREDRLRQEAEKVRDPLTPPYKTGDSVYLEHKAFVIENISDHHVELRNPAQVYPIFRTESRQRFEQMLYQDRRNGDITEFLPADLNLTDNDLQDVLTSEGGLLIQRDKDYISGWIRSGEGNTRVAQKLSEIYAKTAETMNLVSGETIDYFASATGLEIDFQEDSVMKLSFSWREIAAVLRAMYLRERDGFFQEAPEREAVRLAGEPVYKLGDRVGFPGHDRDISGTIVYIGDKDIRIHTGPYSWSDEVVSRAFFEEAIRQDERNRALFIVPEDKPAPVITAQTVAVHPAIQNGLPYDIVFETLHIDQPEPHLASMQARDAAQKAENYRITDDALGRGGAKAKYGYNIEAIRTLKKIEAEGRSASPQEQDVLSRYVGWGALSQVFDKNAQSWEKEYQELSDLLSPEEFKAARSSTLNAHYTSPVVIRAIYTAIEAMGFDGGNILEPSMGVGNFFGLLPESLRASRLYGVELDQLTGRIARQLYPRADITIAGFESTDRRDFYDLAISNVPFGNYKVSDHAYDKLNYSIHDYFFAKALDQVRPGGLIAFITSHFTLDKQSDEVRAYIARRAEFLGAVRLPNTAFLRNAGTEVTSDIIFLKRREQPLEIAPDWLQLGQTDEGVPLNRYFLEHPEMVLGKMEMISGLYGKEAACVPVPGQELAEQLQAAMRNIRGEYEKAQPIEQGDAGMQDDIPADPDVRNYAYTIHRGEVYYRENARMRRPEISANAKDRIRGLIALRESVHRLIDLQMSDGAPEEGMQAARKELNRLYDAFSGRYGLINDRANAKAFSGDSSYYLLCSLEVLDEENRLKRKADMFTKRTIRPHQVATSVDTATEALAISIAERAGVDMPYMSGLTGKDEDTLYRELTGVIYKDFIDPVNGLSLYRTADDFLSGNVRLKLKKYKELVDQLPQEHHDLPALRVNVEALEAVQPADLEATDIEVRLGATWIDPSVIQKFMFETFLPSPYLRFGGLEAHYAPMTAEWSISGKNHVNFNDVNAYTNFGTERVSAYKILEESLNLRDVRVYDSYEDEHGNKKRVLNQNETTLAQTKQQVIKNAFVDWLWKDVDRRRELVETYNVLFNSLRPREYDGRHLRLAGANPEIRLRDHQLNAIAHILYGENVLLAHEVGAGKTFEMVAAAMESRRLGLCSKSLIVVPNHLTEQWAAEFLYLYPAANILVATKKDFEKKSRKRFVSRIATGDYDAIIMGHSQFEKIPVSAERQEHFLQEQIDEINDGIEELKSSRGERFTIKQMERTRKQLEARLDKLHKAERKDDVISFEQLGVDRLFVDEAHHYKNLFLYTKMRNVAGLSATEAQKSSDMLLKCRYLDEITGGKGIVFATGTPVSNSMTEMYTMMRYLQHDTLLRHGLTHFDAWASTYGETQTVIELAPEGTGYRARTRFAKFFNLPELMTMFKGAADIKVKDQLDLPTPDAVFHNVIAEPTEHQKMLVGELSKRAAEVHGRQVDPKEDNMLKITSDGRKLGLDQRIINPLLPDDPGSKLNLCVGNVFRIWDASQADRLTQLIFCDISTPRKKSSKEESAAAQEDEQGTDGVDARDLDALMDHHSDTGNGFCVYDDIRAKLIARGVPADEIAFIHDANTELRKKELFARVRSGQVRVLLGSTFKMGSGTNVQDRLVALHDLDCPWRPGDLEQRAGRIVRQGNLNEQVHIYRYATNGTFDSYLWQTVENKQKFIGQIMTSRSPVRTCEDIDETALSYAEIKALCAGDERIKEKMDLDMSVSKLKLLKSNHLSQQYKLEDSLMKKFPEQIVQTKEYIAGFERDIAALSAHPLPAEGFVGMRIGALVYEDKEKAGMALLEACARLSVTGAEPIGQYRGLDMFLALENFAATYRLTLKGAMAHPVELGQDARGNITRIDNALAQAQDKLAFQRAALDDLYVQIESAKAEIGKPFAQEEELREKTARLAELNSLLNMDGAPAPVLAEAEEVVAKSVRPSILQQLRPSVPAARTGEDHRPHEAVR